MLTSITIQGFKSLQHIQALELGQVNVFIGANGSGKSNLLEAVGFLSAAADGRLDDQALLRRGVRASVPELYKSSFRSSDANEGMKLCSSWQIGQEQAEFNVSFTKKEGSRWDPWQFERFLSRNKIPILNTSQSESKALSLLATLGGNIAASLITTLTDYGIYSPNTPTLRGMETDITQRAPVGLAGGQLAEAVADLLDPSEGIFGRLDLDELFKLLDWVDEIQIVPPSDDLVSASVPTLRNIIRFTDRWMNQGHNQLSAYDASEGALYVLFALVLALHPKSPFLFAIDNFDQAMHPRLARATIRLFSQQILATDPPRQVLLTTHNPLVLDGLDLRDNRIRLFTVERTPSGATRIDRVLVSEEVLYATQNGLSLSNLWVMGRLGGVPDIY
jgi:predicted ATPase